MMDEEELEEIAAELPIWETGNFKCYLCYYKFISVYPFYLEEFECPNCNNMISIEESEIQ